jgi:hypothetical protein
MEKSTAVLVPVAHPSEETTGFSRMCAGVDIVSIAGGSQGRRADARVQGF